MFHIDMGRVDFKRNNSFALMASISEMTKQRACIKLVEVHRFENEFDSVIILYKFMNTIVLKQSKI